MYEAMFGQGYTLPPFCSCKAVICSGPESIEDSVTGCGICGQVTGETVHNPTFRNWIMTIH